jgi:hypothetical protein
MPSTDQKPPQETQNAPTSPRGPTPIHRSERGHAVIDQDVAVDPLFAAAIDNRTKDLGGAARIDVYRPPDQLIESAQIDRANAAKRYAG